MAHLMNTLKMDQMGYDLEKKWINKIFKPKENVVNEILNGLKWEKKNIIFYKTRNTIISKGGLNICSDVLAILLRNYWSIYIVPFMPYSKVLYRWNEHNKTALLKRLKTMKRSSENMGF